MTLTRRAALASLAGAASLAAPIAAPITALAQAAGGPFIANTYGGRWEGIWRNQLMPRFARTIGGRETKLDIGLGSGWVTAFRAAGQKSPPYSVFMGNERYVVLLRQEGFFEPLDTAKLPNLRDTTPVALYPDGMAVTGMISPIGIAYRTDLVKTPPRGWADLWKAEHKGQLGLYAITNSAAIMLLMWAGRHFGRGAEDIDAAVAKFAALKPFPQVAFSGQMTPLLTQGQIAMAPLDLGEVVPLKKRGLPIDFIVPEDGLMMFDQTFSVLAHGQDKATAYQYIDFILSPETQLLMAQQFSVAPVNTKVVLPPELAESLPITPEALKGAHRFDWALAAQLGDRMAETWAKGV